VSLEEVVKTLIEAVVLGINARVFKAIIYSVSAFLPAVAGTFMFYKNGMIDPSIAFEYMLSLEGIVMLSFVVDENGRVRDIKVLQGLGMGLTEVAKRTVQACAFSPGERDGKPVPTRVSSFKIRFNLREDE